MSLRYPIVRIDCPTEEDHAVIFNGMNKFAQSRGFSTTAGAYFFSIRNEEGKVIAAISGFDNFGPAEIGGLWVHEDERGHGYGLALLEAAEAWARKHNCKHMTVFTLKDWPAFAWYQKRGFRVEFERTAHGSAHDAIGCYLIKKL